MILGLSPSSFTELHVVISLLAMFSGLIAILGMLRAKRLEGWTIIFLVMAVLTSATGFLFPSESFGPSHLVGAISLLTLAIAIAARYGYHLEGAWRWTYAACAVLALYLDVFVGIVQAFSKLPFLEPLAPTQSEPPFVVTQIVVMVIFIVLGWRAVTRFHPGPAKARRI
jgi:hypothetical protein